MGAPLFLYPEWMRWSYRLLLAIVLSSGLLVIMCRTHEYAEGPAVVCMGGRTDVTADSPGTVSSIDVKVGERVEAGQTLLRLDDHAEAAEFARLRQEFDLQLAAHLKDLSETSPREALIGLRAQKQLAQARLARRLVRSSRPGVVGDIYLRPGQAVEPGERLLSLVGSDGSNFIEVILPGHYRPLLAPGMPLRLELSGYRSAYLTLTLESIGDDLMGPHAAQQLLGPEISESLSLSGPVVVARAALPSSSFLADGQRHAFHHGMRGWASVTVRSQRILIKLVPGLEPLLASRSR